MDELPRKNILSISGGKDSTAMICLAVATVPPETIELWFAETDNEHQITYDYLNYLEDFFRIPIRRLRADFAGRIERKRAYVAERWPLDGVSAEAVEMAISALVPTGIAFLDLCIWKGRFPSRRAQFCTEELKSVPLTNAQIDLMEQGYFIWSWQGVRSQESTTRRHLPEYDQIGDQLGIYRPIVRWTAESVFEAMDYFGVKPNPLYRQGMRRVGCMPCMNCSKGELAEIAKRWPEVIERIHKWELAVALASKRGAPSFFPAPEDGRADLQGRNIHERVEWASTSRGGRQFGLLADLPAPACFSHYQLCE